MLTLFQDASSLLPIRSAFHARSASWRVSLDERVNVPAVAACGLTPVQKPLLFGRCYLRRPMDHHQASGSELSNNMVVLVYNKFIIMEMIESFRYYSETESFVTTRRKFAITRRKKACSRLLESMLLLGESLLLLGESLLSLTERLLLLGDSLLLLGERKLAVG